jgi:stage V sporulation protein B
MYSENLKSSLIRGTLQLAAAGILVRIIGLVNRMALSRLIGAEGLGLFQMILPLYALLAVITGLGLSGAVTKMVADRSATGDIIGRQKVRQFTLRLVLGTAAITTVLLWLAPALSLKFIPDRRIIGILRLMPAAFIFAALSSILRSYSQGQGKMAPTALSQVAEQVVRVTVGLAAAYFLLPYGLESALTGLFVGIITGEIACLGVLYLMQPVEERKALPPAYRRPSSPMLKEIFSLALPILLIRLSTSITQTVESLMIPARLQAAGFSSNLATTLFGQLAGMALPLLFLPTVLIIPLNTTLVPAVAGAVTLRRRSRLEMLVNLSLWGTLAVGSLSAALLYLAAVPLSAILYGSTASAGLVAKLAPVAPFAYLQFTTAAILHGMGRPAVAVATDLAGTAISLTIIYHLTALPQWGINGVTCAYTVGFIIISLLDYFLIYHFVKKV